MTLPFSASCDSPEDGSRLCLACGLCCQGILHDFVALDPDGEQAARRHGLEVVDENGRPAFRLPCPHHQCGRCSVYDDRPRTCSTYRCKLLRRYMTGETPFEDCLLRIDQVRALLSSIQERLGTASGSFWPPLRELATQAQADGSWKESQELWMDVAVLRAHCRTYFDDASAAPAGVAR